MARGGCANRLVERDPLLHAIHDHALKDRAQHLHVGVHHRTDLAQELAGRRIEGVGGEEILQPPVGGERIAQVVDEIEGLLLLYLVGPAQVHAYLLAEVAPEVCQAVADLGLDHLFRGELPFHDGFLLSAEDRSEGILVIAADGAGLFRHRRDEVTVTARAALLGQGEQHPRRLFRTSVEDRLGIDHARLTHLQAGLAGDTAIGVEHELPIGRALLDPDRAGRANPETGLADGAARPQRQAHERQRLVQGHRERLVVVTLADDLQQLARLGERVGAGTDGLVRHRRRRLERLGGAHNLVHAAADQPAEELTAPGREVSVRTAWFRVAGARRIGRKLRRHPRRARCRFGGPHQHGTGLEIHGELFRPAAAVGTRGAVLRAGEVDGNTPLCEIGEACRIDRPKAGHHHVGPRPRRRTGERERQLLDRLAQEVDGLEGLARPGAGAAGGDAQGPVLATRRIERRAFVAERDCRVRTGIRAAAALAVAVAIAGAAAGAELRVGDAHLDSVRNCCRGVPCSQVFLGMTKLEARPPGGSPALAASTDSQAAMPPSTAKMVLPGWAPSSRRATSSARASVSATTTTVLVGTIFRLSRQASASASGCASRSAAGRASTTQQGGLALSANFNCPALRSEASAWAAAVTTQSTANSRTCFDRTRRFLMRRYLSQFRECGAGCGMPRWTPGGGRGWLSCWLPLMAPEAPP